VVEVLAEPSVSWVGVQGRREHNQERGSKLRKKVAIAAGDFMGFFFWVP